jgi:predicted metal-binding membrane protein
MLTQMAAKALKRDRLIVVVGLVAVSGLAWVYVLKLAASMSSVATPMVGSMDMSNIPMSAPSLQAWQSGDCVLNFMMWAVMMVAMMTPTATPMILTFAKINRSRKADQTPIPTTLIFFFGYLLVWGAFSAAATVAQWGLHSAALLSPEIVSVTPLRGGILLVFAGVYQFTPLKRACLSRCRTPLGFLMTEWRDGTKGALTMGARHGLYCVGCCWLLLLAAAGTAFRSWGDELAVGSAHCGVCSC